MVGSRQTTPSIQDIEVEWPKPWIFFRALLASIVVFLLFNLSWLTFGNAMLVPGLIFAGSFAMPITTLILFLELNISRNVSVFQVAKMVFVGGLIAMIFSLLLFEVSGPRSVQPFGSFHWRNRRRTGQGACTSHRGEPGALQVHSQRPAVWSCRRGGVRRF